MQTVIYKNITQRQDAETEAPASGWTGPGFISRSQDFKH